MVPRPVSLDPTSSSPEWLRRPAMPTSGFRPPAAAAEEALGTGFAVMEEPEELELLLGVTVEAGRVGSGETGELRSRNSLVSGLLVSKLRAWKRSETDSSPAAAWALRVLSSG